ncbi:MAG: sulfatase [Gemmatimonadota bacterium]
MRWLFLAVLVLVIGALGFGKDGFLRSRSPAAVRDSRGGAAMDVLVLAFALALLVGLGELSGVAYTQRVAQKLAFWNLNAAWLTPAVYLLLFSGPALTLALIAAWQPKLVPLQVAVFALGLLATASLSLSFFRVHRLALAVLALGLAVRLAQLAGAHPARMRDTVRRGAGLLGIAWIGLIALGLRQGARERHAVENLPAAREGAPNVLLLILDTVRAQSLSLYGYERPTTPHLERLAAESVVFDRTIAPSNWTLPSHVSLLTGTHPHETTAGYRKPLDGTQPTLAEHLRSLGYATAGIVANRHYTSAETGLSRGFIHYEDYLGTDEPLLIHAWLGNTVGVQRLAAARTPKAVLSALLRFSPSRGNKREAHRRSAAEINEAFLHWSATVEGRPFFAMLNYFDAHQPYESPEPFTTRFAIDEPTPEGLPKDIRAEQGRYDAAIAYLDDQIGALLAELQRRGALDNTIVIVTADHGEEFGEHGGSGHGGHLLMETIHVPLLIRYPRGLPAGVRVSPFTSLHDVPSTIVALATPGVASPLEGRSLQRFWDGSTDPQDPVFLSEMSRGPGGTAPSLGYTVEAERKSLIDGRYQFLWGRQEDDERERVYDLRNDPGGLVDLVGTPAGDTVRARLHRALAAALPGGEGSDQR